MKKRIAPAPQRLVVAPEAHVSRRGLYRVLMGVFLSISLGTAAYLYVRYEGGRQHDQAAIDERMQMQAELNRVRYQLARAEDSEEALTTLRKRFDETRALLTRAEARTRDLEAEAGKWVDPAPVILPAVSLAITGLELVGKDEWREFRLNLARAYSVDPALSEDAPVQLRAAREPKLRGTIRLVVVPKKDPDKRIYVPKGSWKREKGFVLNLSEGRQEIRELFEMPKEGIRDVRVEVLLYEADGYTLIRKVYRSF